MAYYREIYIIFSIKVCIYLYIVRINHQFENFKVLEITTQQIFRLSVMRIKSIPFISPAKARLFEKTMIWPKTLFSPKVAKLHRSDIVISTKFHSLFSATLSITSKSFKSKSIATVGRDTAQALRTSWSMVTFTILF